MALNRLDFKFRVLKIIKKKWLKLAEIKLKTKTQSKSNTENVKKWDGKCQKSQKKMASNRPKLDKITKNLMDDSQ